MRKFKTTFHFFYYFQLHFFLNNRCNYDYSECDRILYFDICEVSLIVYRLSFKQLLVFYSTMYV